VLFSFALAHAQNNFWRGMGAKRGYAQFVSETAQQTIFRLLRRLASPNKTRISMGPPGAKGTCHILLVYIRGEAKVAKNAGSQKPVVGDIKCS
jgi:hypothetical protein